MTDLRASETAVVTGAASGIGLAIARELARSGMNVVVADVDEAQLEPAAAAVRSECVRGRNVLRAACDVTDFDAVTRLAENVETHYGVPKVVVANAGVADVEQRSIWETPVETWRWIYEVNVFGTVHCIRGFLPAMVKSQAPAHFVATASELGLMSDTDSAAYASTKHAVVRIMEGLHLQLLAARSAVRATLLCPGLTSTNLLLSERHRPARWHLGDQAATDHESSDAPPARLEDGACPEAVAAALIEALQRDRFYCVTAPEVDSAVKSRMDDILARRDPRLHVPGVYCGICGRTRPAECEVCSSGSASAKSSRARA